MKIQKIPKKFLIPVAILAVLLLALIIYLFVKDSKKSISSETNKSGYTKISDVTFPSISFDPTSCSGIINQSFPSAEESSTNYPTDPKAEEKLKEIINETKKYTSFALKNKGYFPPETLQNYYEVFVNDTTHTDYYKGGKEKYTQRTVTIDNAKWEVDGESKKVTKKETSTTDAQSIEALAPVRVLEEIINLENRSVTVSPVTPDTYMKITGKSTFSALGTPITFRHFVELTFKDNVLESIRHYSQPENNTDPSSCITKIWVYTHLGDKFVIEEPK